MELKWEWIAFGGAAQKAASYIGLLHGLQTTHPQFNEWHTNTLKGTCGCSSGCIAALALLVNADCESLANKWASLGVESMTRSYFNIGQMMEKFGVDTGERVKLVISEVLASCGVAHDTTFEMLYRLTRKELRVVATNLNFMRTEVFSHKKTPDIKLADAFYWSMSVPFVFRPERYRGDLLVDGACLQLVPLDVWSDSEWESVCLVFITGMRTGSFHGTRVEYKELKDYATGVLACAARSVLRRVFDLKSQKPDRVIHIDICEAADDVFLMMDLPTFRRLFNLGFAKSVSLIYNTLIPSLITPLIKLNVSMILNELFEQKIDL